MTADHLWPCGCLRNDGGAHRADCPDYQTVYPPAWSNRLEDLHWTPRSTSGQEG